MPTPNNDTSDVMLNLIETALDDMKAVDAVTIDVRGRTSIADFMIVVSGTSDRHVRAIAGEVVVSAKKADMPPLGVEGEETGEWVLVDLGDVLVHVMQPAIRDHYNLEKFWQPEGDAAAAQAD